MKESYKNIIKEIMISLVGMEVKNLGIATQQPVISLKELVERYQNTIHRVEIQD